MRAVLRARHVSNETYKYGYDCVLLYAADSRAVSRSDTLLHTSSRVYRYT
jgi:hypothetical protein